MKKIILLFLLLLIPTVVKGEEILPSFSNKTIEMEINQTIELIDTNNVLTNYERINSRSCSVEIIENILKIKSSYRGANGFVILKNKITKKEIWIYVNIAAAGVEIHNFDKNSKMPLSMVDRTYFIDTKYAIFNDKNEIVTEFSPSSGGIALSKKVMAGDYCVRQITPSYGYYLNDYQACFNLGTADGRQRLVYNNQIIKKDLKIEKIYDNKPDEKIDFFVYQNDKLIQKTTTNELGIANISLSYGNYRITQQNKNYEEDEFFNTNITVDETKEVIKINNKEDIIPPVEAPIILEDTLIEENLTVKEEIKNPYTNDYIYIYIGLFIFSIIELKKVILQ